MQRTHPSLRALKSMSIMLSIIPRFQSYEETLDALDRMEREVFVGIGKFHSEEFNALLQAFCTQNEMKEARPVFVELFLRFASNNKTMSILLPGYKESGDVTAMKIFYHEMVVTWCLVLRKERRRKKWSKGERRRKEWTRIVKLNFIV